MIKQLFLIFMLLFLNSAVVEEKEPMIGVVFLTAEEGIKSEVQFHYFDSKKAAVDFYQMKGIVDYALMTNSDKDEKELFDQIDSEEVDGGKTVKFSVNEEGIRADDQAFDYIYGELGLGVECTFNGVECK